MHIVQVRGLQEACARHDGGILSWVVFRIAVWEGVRLQILESSLRIASSKLISVALTDAKKYNHRPVPSSLATRKTAPNVDEFLGRRTQRKKPSLTETPVLNRYLL